ncbi:glycoside hydrolase family 97 catalytic domain-containing protein [Alteromonas sp. S015]|uniref:glycoside hydrolase family 97 catalytic domain-containing protein n=1 Tax=Alteromonas sp. S015 TaxID=3117401 RepID=UPI002FDF5AB1
MCRFFIISCLFVFCLQSKASPLSIQSPDKSLSLFVKVDSQGRPSYWLNSEDTPLILPSTLGISVKGEIDFNRDFVINDYRIDTINQPWERLWGEGKQVENHYTSLSINLEKTTTPVRKINIEFRLFNDGLGFRYILPKQPELSEILIMSENSEFTLSGEEIAWWTPQDFDSYEHIHRQTKFSDVEAVNTPITLKLPSGHYVSIHEAALTDYAGMTLVKKGDATLVSELVPWPDGIKVKGSAPLTTPWRTIQFAENAAGLINSPLLENLNLPNRISDTSWIKPMKYVGIWWGMHMRKYTWEAGPKHGATTENTKAYIDFAARHGIGGVLVEGWNKGWETWHTPLNQQDFTQAYDDFDLLELAQYAKHNGVTLIGHHETGGNIPEYERQLEDAFALYRKAGVHALKTGYAGAMRPTGTYHHSQPMVNHYRHVLTLAADNQIMLNAHEPIKPTGLRRTFPNMMTREGGRGMEWNGWSKGNPPEHTVSLPFTRLLAGPMDYTPGIFDIRFDRQGQYRIHTTLARQLAHYVTLYSPMQMAADMVENYIDHAAFTFIENVPTSWDETQVQHAEIGDYYVVARRDGQKWFVGATTDEHPRQLPLNFSFLLEDKQYVARIYSDGDDTDYTSNPEAFEYVNVVVNKHSEIPLVMASGGGVAIEIDPLLDKHEGTLNAQQYTQKVAHRLASFEKGGHFGEVIKVHHLAENKSVTLKPTPHRNYSDDGAITLIDGERGSADYTSQWLGFRNIDFTATIDLGERQKVKQISAGFMQSILHSIMFPTAVTFDVSSDNERFTTVGMETYETTADVPDFQRKDFTAEFSEQDVRYIRVTATSLGVLPDWHIRPGQEVFIFADEIIVN